LPQLPALSTGDLGVGWRVRIQALLDNGGMAEMGWIPVGLLSGASNGKRALAKR